MNQWSPHSLSPVEHEHVVMSLLMPFRKESVAALPIDEPGAGNVHFSAYMLLTSWDLNRRSAVRGKL